MRCIHVSLLSMQAYSSIRPTMSSVILMISSSSVTLPNPTKPTFVKNSESNLGGSALDRSCSGIHVPQSFASIEELLVPSINNVTITELEAR